RGRPVALERARVAVAGVQRPPAPRGDAGGPPTGAGRWGARHREGPRVGPVLARREGLAADDVLGDLLAAGVVDLEVDIYVRRDAAGVGDGRLDSLRLAGGDGARRGRRRPDREARRAAPAGRALQDERILGAVQRGLHGIGGGEVGRAREARHVDSTRAVDRDALGAIAAAGATDVGR